jgi:hypothetical protein
MSETPTQTRINLSESRSAAFYAHGLQLGLSVAVLSLDVYGVHYIPYNVLVSSLIVVSISTLLARRRSTKCSRSVPFLYAFILFQRSCGCGNSTAHTLLAPIISGCSYFGLLTSQLLHTSLRDGGPSGVPMTSATRIFVQWVRSEAWTTTRQRRSMPFMGRW